MVEDEKGQLKFDKQDGIEWRTENYTFDDEERHYNRRRGSLVSQDSVELQEAIGGGAQTLKEEKPADKPAGRKSFRSQSTANLEAEAQAAD